MRDYLLSLPLYGTLADVGCGNGKYFGVRPDMTVLGSDRSTGLASQAGKLCKPCERPQQPSSTQLGHCSDRYNEARTGADSEAQSQSGGCHFGRSKAETCPHADVLVADAMQLPYKVKRQLRPIVTDLLVLLKPMSEES